LFKERKRLRKKERKKKTERERKRNRDKYWGHPKFQELDPPPSPQRPPFQNLSENNKILKCICIVNMYRSGLIRTILE
jgi:hypothetical protein